MSNAIGTICLMAALTLPLLVLVPPAAAATYKNDYIPKRSTGITSGTWRTRASRGRGRERNICASTISAFSDPRERDLFRRLPQPLGRRFGG